MIVIKSLVPGGVAQVDGRLLPGDRLIFVNDEMLENASLDEAVNALKGAPKGNVRIGVKKALPLGGSEAHQQAELQVNLTPKEILFGKWMCILLWELVKNNLLSEMLHCFDFLINVDHLSLSFAIHS